MFSTFSIQIKLNRTSQQKRLRTTTNLFYQSNINKREKVKRSKIDDYGHRARSPAVVETGVQEDRTSVLVDVNEVVVEVDVVVNQYSKNLPCLKKCIKRS